MSGAPAPVIAATCPHSLVVWVEGWDGRNRGRRDRGHTREVVKVPSFTPPGGAVPGGPCAALGQRRSWAGPHAPAARGADADWAGSVGDLMIEDKLSPLQQIRLAAVTQANLRLSRLVPPVGAAPSTDLAVTDLLSAAERIAEYIERGGRVK